MFWDIDIEVFAMWHWLVWFLSSWRTPPPLNILKKKKFQRAVHTLYLTSFEITTAWRVKAFRNRRCFVQGGGWAQYTRKDRPASCRFLELGLPLSVSFPLLSKERARTHTHTHTPHNNKYQSPSLSSPLALGLSTINWHLPWMPACHPPLQGLNHVLL